MDKKFKRYKVDYAAAYRHYIDFGGGRTLEKFCQDEGYDFEKFKRYGRDAFWQHLIYKDDSEYEKQKETVMSTGDVDTPEQIAELTSRQDWTAREKELNERHARELYEQKMFLDKPSDKSITSRT